MTLRAESISMTYPGNRSALRSVSVDLAPGSVTAIVGPNGAGKSTLLRVLAGVVAPSRGTVTLDGNPILKLSVRQRARRLALVAQQPSVAFDFDVDRVVSFGAEGGGSGAAAIGPALERFGLTELRGVPFGALSVGQRQRVSLARAWAQIAGPTKPKAGSVLLADEPVSALDPAASADAIDAIRSVARSGATVGVVLHDLSLAAQVADRVVVLSDQGSLVVADTPAAALDPATLSQVFGIGFSRADVEGIGVVLLPDPSSRP